ncbi:phospho-N-acetylmuramoyl-pentapeptide-transferase [Agrilactobacillus fermenti]|uniref:phospho-N-acetylmuramoyl-pentapeptide- transferase n=1 Tax=Agrilactobacillus fermenti TaxID=2586909 RepID=UPI001E43039A|nr:phospho-N-acetylmuramoyl-pentapeptide-transferase [Agrilactobacillus fermenti]MCD2255314.1 phospho-N-acetylmuramoyl-pentapeptide-transferase [Agrilactobacillus fermenti]
MNTLELVLTLLMAFILTVIIMPRLITYFRKRKEGQMIREEGPSWHEKKSGTPTMGGVAFLIVVAAVSLVSAGLQHQLTHGLLITLFILLLYGVVGFLDDGLKLFRHQNEGLKAWQKFLAQVLGGAIFLWVYFADHLTRQIFIPLLGNVDAIWFFVLFALFWLVGFSNAVNLTDGLDGLVGGLAIIAFITYGIIAYRDRRPDILILIIAFVGSLAGFLIFNHKPAKIFMGDVGSLAIGGVLAAISILLHRQWSLLLIGLVFVLETASVILQVASFKLTGKRIFRMTPIHHHFELLGWSEWRVVTTFWGVGALTAIIYLLLFL